MPPALCDFLGRVTRRCPLDHRAQNVTLKPMELSDTFKIAYYSGRFRNWKSDMTLRA